MRRLTGRFDALARWLACHERRLIGIALLRIVLGLATVLYCLADYDRRQFLWGPDSYDSAAVASANLPHWGFSLFFLSNSPVWFELLFHAVIVVSVAFAIFGGRALTLVQAILMWSLHYRNQDILEGGDNLAQILIIFMIFSVSNAYFAPGAKKRRAKLRAETRPTVGTTLHNFAAYLIVFQTCVVYFTAGYWKITGKVWQDGAAMYYISRITGFQLSATYAHLMSNAFVGTAVCYFTIFTELAFPFAVLSARAWIRKANTVAIESMHLGIMVFMGLVCFGMLMIGADFACLRDEDYRSMYRWARRSKERIGVRVRRLAPPALADGRRMATKADRHAGI